MGNDFVLERIIRYENASTGYGYHYLTLPAKIIESLRWGKGDTIEFSPTENFFLCQKLEDAHNIKKSHTQRLSWAKSTKDISSTSKGTLRFRRLPRCVTESWHIKTNMTVYVTPIRMGSGFDFQPVTKNNPANALWFCRDKKLLEEMHDLLTFKQEQKKSVKTRRAITILKRLRYEQIIKEATRYMKEYEHKKPAYFREWESRRAEAQSLLDEYIKKHGGKTRKEKNSSSLNRQEIV